MKRVLSVFVMLSALLVAALPSVSHAVPADCAFEDVNDNGLFDAGTDIQVLDSQWMGGTSFTTNHPFVVPAGCLLPDLIQLKNPAQGVFVTATKITWLGSLTYVPPGGKGIVLIADPARVPAPALGDGSVTIGDGVTSNVKIEAGGYNTLANTEIAVFHKSIAIIAAGTCSISNAQLIGRAPLQDTRVGVRCGGDMTIRQTLIKGSRVNLQSLTGKIDARSFAPVVDNNLAQACDDPALNILAGGNNNGVLDAGDFPCQINLAALGQTPVFNNPAALAAYCLDPTLGGVNRFQAFNDPLIMIAKTDLDLHGVQGGETEVLGRYRVTLASEDGNINLAHTFINHGPAPVPGGAKIWIMANPTSVVRLPVDTEDFLGPSSGTTNIDSSCMQSNNKVNMGRDAGGLLNVTGTPDPAPCKQFPADFNPVLNATF
jgi:hypothetical protein